MAVTALKIGDQRLKFMTMSTEILESKDGKTEKSFLNIDLRVCDENFVPVGIGSISIHEDDEEVYHRNLRIQATEKGHFVPEESTDHHWNPGYNPEDDKLPEEAELDGDSL